VLSPEANNVTVDDERLMPEAYNPGEGRMLSPEANNMIVGDERLMPSAYNPQTAGCCRWKQTT